MVCLRNGVWNRLKGGGTHYGCVGVHPGDIARDVQGSAAVLARRKRHVWPGPPSTFLFTVGSWER